jgi:hypothetical protein
MSTHEEQVFFTTIDRLATQWPGVGAVPGRDLLPTSRCQQRPSCALRPLTIPGMAAGPHGIDVYTADSTPANCSQFPMPFGMPDKDVFLDGMNPEVWGLPTSGTPGAVDSFQAWTYPRGAWP